MRRSASGRRTSTRLARGVGLGAALGIGLTLAAAGAAWAGDPIMPLSQVHRGMSCTGYSVVQGTTISPFNVQVIDVVTSPPSSTESGGAPGGGPAILVQVSGPAVDVSGVAEGFSGSPIYCPDSHGVQRVIGAIAYGVGDYGNKLVLATPIEAILSEPVVPPSNGHPSATTARRARPLAVPLVVSGVSPAVGDLFRSAAARIGRILYVSPGAPPALAFPPQTLRPGASVAIADSSGDIQVAGVGTVAYTDGNNVWAFGHAFDAVGRRSLFLEDAYVYAVASNPLPIQGTPPGYKIEAPGHDLGTFTNDAENAAVGSLGALPPHFPLQVMARGADSGDTSTLNSQVADESAIGLPTGISSLSLVAPAAVAQAATGVLHGAPPQQSGTMCFQIALQESKTPLGFCNNYVEDDMVDASGQGPQDNGLAPYMADLATALQDIDGFKLGVLHPTSAKITLDLTHGVSQAYMVAARGPQHKVRPGQVAKLVVLAQVVRGVRTTKLIPVRIPRQAHRGQYLIKLTGTPSDSAGAGAVTALVSLLGGGGSGASGSTGPISDEGPPTVEALAHELASIHRYDGVRAKFIRGGGAKTARAAAAPRARRQPSSSPAAPTKHASGGGVPVYRDPTLRLSGTVAAAVRIG